MPKPKTISPMQIATRQDDGVATVWIYDYIGQLPELWLPKEERSEKITAMELVDKLNTLAQTNERINLRINSPGGSVFEGEAMVNAIRDCSATVHTYNDGLAASMAATIWLAGHERHMARNAKMMIHSPANGIYGNAQKLREEADKLDKMTEASAESIAALTEMTAEEVNAQFFADGKDHWMSYKDVEALGFIEEEEAYEAAQRTSGDVEQLTYPELIQQFKATPPQERKPSSLLAKARNLFTPTQQTPITPENSEAVNLKELRAAIKNGDITLEQVSQLQEELSTPANAPEQTLTETIQLAVSGAVKEAMAERDATIEALQEEITQLGDAPGDRPAGAGAGGDPGSVGGPTQLEQDASMFNDWATKGFSPFRNPLTQVPE